MEALSDCSIVRIEILSDWSIVRIEALSSSSAIPSNVERSEYEFIRGLNCVVEDPGRRMVSVSELELIVDIVRNDTTLDALSESDWDDGAIMSSGLYAPQ